jgi:hypothetical protein
MKNMVNATYQIDNTVVSTPADITFGWSGTQEGSSFAGLGNSQLGIARYNGAGYDAFAGTGDNTANTATASFSAFSPFVVGTNVPKTALKVFLQGAYNTTLSRHKDVSTNWALALNNNALGQPYNTAAFGNYAGTESVSPGFFTSSVATTDITDWVLLELRDQTTPATVIAKRAAFVREDGVVVDLDGISNVVFGGVANGSYFLVIRHRNHLPIRTAVTIAVDGSLSATAPALYDMTTAQAQAYQNGAITTNAAMKDNAGVFSMWGGNANSNTQSRASGGQSINDYLYLANTVLGGNIGLILGPPSSAVVYNSADMNMDGVVRSSGGQSINDYLFLVNTVLGGNIGLIYSQHQ